MSATALQPRATSAGLHSTAASPSPVTAAASFQPGQAPSAALANRQTLCSGGAPGTRQRILQTPLYNPLRERSASSSRHPLRRVGGALKVQAIKQDAFVRVEAGDTLASLAQAFGVSRSAFLESNTDLIASENLIFEGDLLRVPAKAWKGQAPPGMEGRVVLRSSKSAADMLAGVGTALHLLPSYISLGPPSTTLPAGLGGWLILGGVVMVVLGSVGKLVRGSKPGEAAGLPAVRAGRAGKEVVKDKLGQEVEIKSYATPGMPSSMKGPYTSSFQTPEVLPNKAMQASILGAPKKPKPVASAAPNGAQAEKEVDLDKSGQEVEIKAYATPGMPPSMKGPYTSSFQTTEVLPNKTMQASILGAPGKPQPVASAALKAVLKVPRTTAPGTAAQQKEREVKAKLAEDEKKRNDVEDLKIKQQKEEEEKKQRELVLATVAAAAGEEAKKAAAVASTPLVTAPGAASPTVVESPAAQSAKLEEAPQRTGWGFPQAIFGRDKDVTTFKFGLDSENKNEPQSTYEPQNGSPKSSSSADSTGPWGPYTLGWAAEEDSADAAVSAQGAGSREAGPTGSTEQAPRELTVAQKAVQAAVPALALGLGAVSAVTSGWQGAMEAIGLTFVGSLVTYDLLWAEKRDELLKELKEIRSPADVSKFLEKRGISPK